MAVKHPSQLTHFSIPLFLFLNLTLALSLTLDHPDLHPLINFKSSADPSNRLSGWNYSAAADLCNWTGVSCSQNRVSRLVLENLDLNGSFIEPLTSLTHLRVLSLKSNSLSGPIPHSFSNLTSLKLLFLSRNRFSGEFPPSLLSLRRLFRLDLSRNNFSGPIPSADHLTHLLTLRLEDNNFSGLISNLDLPVSIQDFNVSGNRLSGEIPKSLSGYPVSSFSGNTALCGGPLGTKCQGIGPGGSGSSDPTRPGGVEIASPVTPGVVVSSSPSSLPTGTSPKKPAAANSGGEKSSQAAKISPVALIAIILGDVLILAVVSLLLYCYFWRNYAAKLMTMRKGGGKLSTTTMESEKIVYSSSPYPDPARMQSLGGGRGMAAMVFFEGAKRFELEDLLRASAEMLGKGGFGTAYKAVLDDGNVVAVKRLKDANIVSGGGGGGVGGKLEQHMEILGRLRHPNLVSLKAYYFAREEKLLVYEYMPNGSLFWLLHGNRGPGRTPLDWNIRLKIAAGAARGLAFIHSSCSSLKLTHGNIKSTNILLDQSGNARVSDFGLSLFASSSSSSNGYRAPESNVSKLTQKSDVYSFGVLLLEMLTGKCPNSVSGDHYGGGSGGGGAVDLPRWVQSVVREEWTAEVFDLELMRYKDIEEEMVGLLQIAMVCSSPAPDQRPKMGQVVKMIEELRGVSVDHQVSPGGHESVSDSPLSEDTATSQ